MPTTTNYGWTTPADTDLVKDGASAIRTLGTAIDTTVFNNANAAIAKTIVDAKGDLIVASGSDAVARLAVGTNDYVLTADSTATNGIKWAAPAASGMTLISTTSLSGTSTSLTSIPTTYKELKLVVINASINSGTTYYGVRLNGDTGADKHLSGYQGQYDGAANVAEESDTSFLMTWASSNADAAYFQLFLPRYTDTAANQFVVADGFTTVAASQQFSNTLTGLYKKSAAITQIDIITRNGTSTFDGGTAYLYGVS